MRKIAIWGFGITGKAALNYFLKSKKYTDYQIDVYESKPIAFFRDEILENERINYFFDNKKIEQISNYEILLISPGIPRDNQTVQNAYTNGVRVCNDVMIFIEEFGRFGKIVGITGSNGKSTIASLTHGSINKVGKKSILVGNIGQSPLDFLINSAKSQWKETIAVLELSSFQLEIFEPEHFTDIAVISNLSANHLDRHHDDMREYADVKMKILDKTKSQIVTVIDDPGIKKYILPKIDSDLLHKITLENEGAGQLSNFVLKNFGLSNKIKLPGKHNLYNISICMKILQILEIEINNQRLIDFIKNYPGLEHRIEFVRNYNGLDFYNDSKSTSPDATRVAIESFNNSKKIILIMGGKDKNTSFNNLNLFIKDRVCKIIILSQEIDSKIIELAKLNCIPYKIAADLDEAINLVLSFKIDNGLILFSPGSSSGLKFKNFEERGKRFKEVVNSLS